MDKTQVLEQIKSIGIVPVVRASSGDEALLAIAAIMAGGLPIAEITMTVPGAVRVIERIAERYGDEVLVGAGTVLSAETAKECVRAGAQFIVSPALDLETIAYCRKEGFAVFPGALTPTEIVQAWSAGADFVKVFPCGAMGGASYIKSLKAPLPQIDLIPTGGVSLANAASFIQAGAVALGVGADLVDLNAIRAGQAEKITQATRAYIEAVRTARAAMSALRAT
jgi:2-dehydro-3-deoxyphosphogluconate aldolase / (4S)-4-hydroxy-2-oxoglutarate aldolase